MSGTIHLEKAEKSIANVASTDEEIARVDRYDNLKNEKEVCNEMLHEMGVKGGGCEVVQKIERMVGNGEKMAIWGYFRE